MIYLVENRSKGNVLLDNGQMASSFLARLKGLLGKKSLKAGGGLIIKPCNSIHTFGMKFPIDVAFVNQDHKVIKIMDSLAANRISPIVVGAKYVIEAKAGELISKGLEMGDVLELKQVK